MPHDSFHGSKQELYHMVHMRMSPYFFQRCGTYEWYLYKFEIMNQS